MQQFVMDRFAANGLTTCRRRLSRPMRIARIRIMVPRRSIRRRSIAAILSCSTCGRRKPRRFHLRRFHLGRVRRRERARGACEDFFDRRQCARRRGRTGSRRVASRQPVSGREADRAAREVIEAAGFGERYLHRTGHSIGREVHGTGANLDSLETDDHRMLIDHTCFSVEPGIYLRALRRAQRSRRDDRKRPRTISADAIQRNDSIIRDRNIGFSRSGSYPGCGNSLPIAPIAYNRGMATYLRFLDAAMNHAQYKEHRRGRMVRLHLLVSSGYGRLNRPWKPLEKTCWRRSIDG